MYQGVASVNAAKFENCSNTPAPIFPQLRLAVKLFDCPVMKNFLDCINFVSFQTVLSGYELCMILIRKIKEI